MLRAFGKSHRVRTIIAAGLFLIASVAVAICTYWSGLGHQARRAERQNRMLSSGQIKDEGMAATPQPELTPRQVVDIQLRALQLSGGGHDGIATCFEFASPANRRMTGPLDRFTQMVSGPPYDAMLQHVRADVEHVEIAQGVATVIVTLVDQNGQNQGFMFVLSKQTDKPYVDCWMTDSVAPLRRPPAPRKPRISA